MKTTRTLLALLLLASFAACRSGGKNDPILRLSAEESLAQGKKLLDAKKYGQARPYLTHAFEVEPNSAAGREALLLSADSLYLDGGQANWIQAEAKYRDFQNRFPTSDRAAYVQYQIANSLSQRIGRPDRELSTSSKALEAYEDLLRLYPTSPYSEQAQAGLEKVRTNLAEHEFLVGHFYLRFGIPAAAASRFESLLAKYPAFGGNDRTLFELARAYDQLGRADDAQSARGRLEKDYPQSTWAAKAKEKRG